MSKPITTWRVVTAETSQLEAALNDLSRDGYTIYHLERSVVSESGSENGQQWLPGGANFNTSSAAESKSVSSTHSKWFGHNWVIVALRVDN